MSPRICLLTESFHPKIGGGETHVRLLSATLVRRGMPVIVLTQRQLSSWPRVDRVDGVPVRRVGVPGFARFGKFLMMPAALLWLWRHRREHDVIYVCGLRTLGLVAVLAARLTGARSVLRAESCGELAGEPGCHRVIRALLGARNALLRHADRFLSISRAIEQEYRACGVPAGRIVTIVNGIDTTRFAPATPAEKQALRRRLRLPDRLLCVYTGKLNRGKGLEMLLRAWRRLVARHSELHLVLVGSGAHQSLSCEDELRWFVEAHELAPKVTFTGAVAEVEAYLKASDLFVLPSESESFGLSLVEAMACGLAAIASRVGGIPDIVDDGVHGILIDADDEEGLIAAVERLVRSPATMAELGQAARAKACSTFAIETTVAEHENLFRALVPTGRSR